VDFLEFENLGGSETILKCLRSGQKNQIFRGKSQDKISLCYFKMKICHRITCGVSKYLGGRKIGTYLYLSQLVCSPYLYNKLVYVSDHFLRSPRIFSYSVWTYCPRTVVAYQREERDREETQHGFWNFTHDGRLSTLYSSCAGFPFVWQRGGCWIYPVTRNS
jgi:hypothetical protein